MSDFLNEGVAVRTPPTPVPEDPTTTALGMNLNALSWAMRDAGYDPSTQAGLPTEQPVVYAGPVPPQLPRRRR